MKRSCQHRKSKVLGARLGARDAIGTYPTQAGNMAKRSKADKGEIRRNLMQRLDAYLCSPDAHSIAPLTETIMGTVIYGLNQLEAAPVEALSDIVARDKGLDGVMSNCLAAPAHGHGNFIERWATDMCREMGAEELEKFALTLGEAHHVRAPVE